MEVAYYTTTNFIRHEGNMVDLAEYRRKLNRAKGVTEGVSSPTRPVRPARRRRASAPILADYCASGAIVVMAITFVVKMLQVL